MEDINEKILKLEKEAKTEKIVKKPTTKLADIIKEINGRFQSVGDFQMEFMSFFKSQLNLVSKRVRKNELQTSVQDISITALLEVLLEKGVLTEEEYAEKAQLVYNRAMDDTKK